MNEELLGVEIEDPGNIKQRLKYYCEVARRNREEREKADKAARRDKED
ncbi:MAG: hypothetical protein IKN47_00830 [Lachnospiraceae bacterium]|nr:hypothetical protein [Lachnospiraceae bacterium]